MKITKKLDFNNEYINKNTKFRFRWETLKKTKLNRQQLYAGNFLNIALSREKKSRKIPNQDY